MCKVADVLNLAYTCNEFRNLQIRSVWVRFFLWFVLSQAPQHVSFVSSSSTCKIYRDANHFNYRYLDHVICFLSPCFRYLLSFVVSIVLPLLKWFDAFIVRLFRVRLTKKTRKKRQQQKGREVPMLKELSLRNTWLVQEGQPFFNRRKWSIESLKSRNF